VLRVITVQNVSSRHCTNTNVQELVSKRIQTALPKVVTCACLVKFMHRLTNVCVFVVVLMLGFERLSVKC
jgi:hypothetical protein